MKKEVLFVLLDDYADWEGAFLASSLNSGVTPDGNTRYIAKTVAPTPEAVRSLGGFRTVPDYCFQNVPADYAALILVGGTRWDSDEALQVIPIVEQALKRGIIVGAICNAASFLAAHGFLNHVRHTGNTVEQLKLWGKGNYTNEAGFVEQQAVADGLMVTANGTGYLEFCRELLSLLEADSKEHITASYRFQKNGLYPAGE